MLQLCKIGFSTQVVLFLKAPKIFNFPKLVMYFPLILFENKSKITKLNTKKMNILTFCLLQQVLERQLQFLSFITYARPPGVSEGF